MQLVSVVYMYTISKHSNCTYFILYQLLLALNIFLNKKHLLIPPGICVPTKFYDDRFVLFAWKRNKQLTFTFIIILYTLGIIFYFIYYLFNKILSFVWCDNAVLTDRHKTIRKSKHSYFEKSNAAHPTIRVN